MHLSRASVYAVRSVVHLAALPKANFALGEDIAVATGAPAKLLRKQLTKLEHAGVVRSRRGSRGGYGLGRSAPKITLLDIIEAVDGPVVAEVGFEAKDASGLNARLPGACRRATDMERQQLSGVRVAELVDRRG